MPTALIALKDIVIDPEKDIDLTALPEQEAISLIKNSFSFLSTELDVSINNGIAVITLPEDKEERAEEALKWYRQGQKQAQQGDYKRAIRLFERTLERLPNHVEARRNLAMSHLELGDKEEAKRRVIQVLKLDPKDPWSYLLLGNIYFKHEKDFPRAEKWYSRAYELNPDDPFLLTNYGALMAERGNHEQAEEFLERAIKSEPTYPNSYYGLALLHVNRRKPELALPVLDQLFEKAKPIDVRGNPLYEEARKLYFDVAGTIAQGDYDRFMRLVEERKDAVARETGHPVLMTPDESLQVVKAVTQPAWKHGTAEHRIRYRQVGRSFLPYLLAHELTHIQMEYEARRVNRNKSFSTTNATRDRMMRSISEHVYKLQKMGLSEADITKVTLDWVNGLANQLFNIPLDIVIESRLDAEMPELRPSQFVTLTGWAAENIQVLTNRDIKRLSPPRIYRASVAMNATYALLMDSLYPNRAEFAKPYRAWEHFQVGEKLFSAWQDLGPNPQPGDEYNLVDEFARILNLQDLYEWRTDEDIDLKANLEFFPNSPEEENKNHKGPGAAPQGPTNPELLKEKEPATVMYLLSALERFDKMTDEQIRQLGTEVGIVGMEGIDYAASEKKYTLKAFPDETFSGLQLLCFMYLAFKRIDPTVNTGLDFDEAYQTALKLYKP